MPGLESDLRGAGFSRKQIVQLAAQLEQASQSPVPDATPVDCVVLLAPDRTHWKVTVDNHGKLRTERC